MSLSLNPGNKAGGLLTSSVQLVVSSQSYLSSVVTVLLVASSAWIAGQAIWFGVEDDQSITLWKPQRVTGGRVEQPALDLTELKNANLFGVYSENALAPEVAAPVVQNAPKTRLNLVLVGAVASSQPENSLAVISNKGNQSTYGVGEVIEGTRAKLKAVLIDRVIIDNSGRDETLMLEGIEYKKLTDNGRTSVRNSSDSGNSPVSKLEAIRAEITQNPQVLLQYIRLSQVRNKEGKISGYRVRPGKDRVLFESVGLKNGDIATHLNGEELTDPKTMSKVWQSLSELTEVNLTVERGGQVEEIYIQF
ncbi:type II secretion system protein GspC [Vibrio sp. JC009]|uniref:type II secretion system protein GspC n=1 Tax=Vibrio sp. JC009 TaxID=2912314 RepID=UPI0023AEDA8E|nr:type II secretion system protein GspC [Vibrio sp. JC009]WED21924.1 type II secretion system protein GspC [Vibrio sp. JC009]